MVSKNWNTISNCEDESLQLFIAFAHEGILDGLCKGFPEFFLREGEQHPPLEREKFVALMQRIDRKKALSILKEIGVKYEDFYFAGTEQGSTDGISYSSGTYPVSCHTPYVRNYSEGDYICRSSKKIGEQLEYTGKMWVVVQNSIWNERDKFGCLQHNLLIISIESFK